MADYDIALSGLEVARRAIELVGTNIANVATDGYHRQDLRIEPLDSNRMGELSIGGSRVAVVLRSIDGLLEGEILRQQPLYGQASQELSTLQSIESALDNVDAKGLVQAINDFFGSLTELAAHPDSQAMREQAVWAADSMASQFRNLGSFFEDLQEELLVQAQSLVADANQLARNTAQLNNDIESVTVRGGSANLLKDKRDQAIQDLAELVDAQANTVSDTSGVTDVVAWGTPLVSGSHAIELDVQVTEGGKLGVSVEGAEYYTTDLTGGRIGGLLNLANNIVPDLVSGLDALAKSIVDGINARHVQGVGTAGAFTGLTGRTRETGALSEWSEWGDTLTAGTLNVRVSDLQAGTVARAEIDVDGADTLADVAARLDAVAGIDASVAGGALRIEASDPNRYRFDFLAVPVLTVDAGWTGTSAPSVRGTYTGEAGGTYTATVTTGGTVGLTQGAAVQVTNPALSDTSGLLAAAGVNTFLTGDSALTMGVRREIMDDSRLLATAAGEGLNDNVNVRRMAEVGETPLAALGNMAPPDRYRQYITSVAQQVSVTKARSGALEDILNQLYAQRNDGSGVDINEEAGKLLIFEQMHQALAKLVETQQRTVQYLIEII